MTYEEIRKNEEINLLIARGNEVLGALGYTEHSKKHAAKVAATAGKILKDLGYKKTRLNLRKLQDICMISEIVSTGMIMHKAAGFWHIKF